MEQDMTVGEMLYIVEHYYSAEIQEERDEHERRKGYDRSVKSENDHG